jgi:hypothetical protein
VVGGCGQLHGSVHMASPPSPYPVILTAPLQKKYNKLRGLRISTENRDFSVFLRKKFLSLHEASKHVLTVWIFNTMIYRKLFYLSKTGLCM